MPGRDEHARKAGDAHGIEDIRAPISAGRARVVAARPRYSVGMECPALGHARRDPLIADQLSAGKLDIGLMFDCEEGNGIELCAVAMEPLLFVGPSVSLITLTGAAQRVRALIID